jgi:hypothetical protein
MPFVFAISSKSQAENFTTSSSANTEIDAGFIKPGATRPFSLLAMRSQGKGAGLTALSGIVLRLKQWTSTASSGGSSVTPAPVQGTGLAPASVATAGIGTSGGTAAVTSGTGGPSIKGGFGMGASGPGGWVAPNPDAPPQIDGGATQSLDIFSSSGTASMNYEFDAEIQEC